MGLTAPNNLRPLIAQLRKAEAELHDPQALLKAWGVTILAEVDANFRAEGRPPWKPLAPSTIAARRKGKGGGTAKILQDTGALRRSFDFTTTARRVTAFSPNPVAVYAEFGTRPHEIRARNAKYLAIPVGPKSFAGLGRAKPNKRGSFTLGGKTRTGHPDVMFRMKVNHPGTAPRPMLPTDEQIIPKLTAVGRRSSRACSRGASASTHCPHVAARRECRPARPLRPVAPPTIACPPSHTTM